MEPEIGRGGIGFMSTQKRASRFSPWAQTCRTGETRRHRRQCEPRSWDAECSWRRHNGHVPRDRLVDLVLVGHKLSARGSATWTVCSAGCRGRTSWFAAFPLRGFRLTSVSRSSCHSHPFLACFSPSGLAAGPGQDWPGGKVRWPKKFAFPPRRMRRG
jgi:hypothetical protein